MSDYESTTRTKFATLAVNNVIDNIIQKNFDGDAPKNRCFISVIGYNHNVKELCSGWLKNLDASPLRYETLKKKTPDGAGGLVEVEVKRPVWVEPIDKDGSTNMLGAFQLAKDLVEKWMADNTDGPAPVIINISDGVPYYDGKDPKECMKETVSLANEIMELRNNDGNVLIFNAQIYELPLRTKMLLFWIITQKTVSLKEMPEDGLLRTPEASPSFSPTKPLWARSGLSAVGILK